MTNNVGIVTSRLKGDLSNKSKTSAGVSSPPADVNDISKTLNKFRSTNDQLPTFENKLDLLYFGADGKEKAEMRRDYPEYNFRAKKFREDMKSGLNREIKTDFGSDYSDPFAAIRDMDNQKFEEIKDLVSESESKGLPYLMGLIK